MSNISWSTAMSSSIQSRSNTASSATTSSAGGGDPPVPNPIGGHAHVDGPIGPVAILQQRATTLQHQATRAAAVAREAVADAANINNAHNVIVAQHRKMFLASAFGINPDGTPIDPSLLPKKLKAFKSVKTVEQYNYIVEVLQNWGDDAFVKDAPPNDPKANKLRAYRKDNIQGYHYVKQYVIEVAECLDGSPNIILKHKKNGKIVLHMLDIFDVIHEAHSRQGHMKGY